MSISFTTGHPDGPGRHRRPRMRADNASQKNQYKEPAVTLHIGDVMPDVNLVDQDLRPWSISGHVGRPLVLILHRHLA